MNMKERRKELIALSKAKRILENMSFNVAERFWLRKYKPYLYYLKYGYIDEYYDRPCTSEPYRIYNRKARNFANYCSNAYSINHNIHTVYDKK